ncbi:somatostatin receptor type 2-like [Amphiura filiformis]|uniref:somatostatin receptor type 2-like n=1 Tax=Amphiura filiformis TaxID=82378 RepID=UPI003B2209EF
MDSATNASHKSCAVETLAHLQTVYIEDDEAAENWLHTPIDDIIYKILLPAVVTFGLAGNAAFLFMVARLSRMKTPLNFFLVNLAINDIIFLISQSLFLMYVFFVTPVSYRYPFKTTGSCVIIYLIGYLSYYCSISIITLVAIERFYAICQPLKHREMQHKRHTLKVITAAYMISAVLAVLTLMKRMKIHECCLKWPDTERYQHIPMVFRYCGPLLGIPGIVITMEIMYSVLFFLAAIVNGYLYAKIILELGSRTLAVNNDAGNRNISVRNQVAKALVINGILFFLTQLPMRLNDINEILGALEEPQCVSPNQRANDLLSFSVLFLFMNSSLNPYVYAFSSSNYRKGFKDAFSYTRQPYRPVSASVATMKTSRV